MRRCGFSLVELSIVLVFMGVIAGFALKSGQMDGLGECEASTQTQLKDIENAVTRYVDSNNRYPMPASRTVGVEDIAYGREAKAPAQIAALDSVGGVTFGALPFQELGLAASYGSDCWGRKFTYAVTTNLTDSNKFTAVTNPNVGTTAYNGTITVESSATNVLNNAVAYAVISHGADGFGAVPANYRGADKKWCTAGAVLESENCDVSNAVLVAAPFNDGKDSGNNKFDDLIVFHGKQKRTVNGAWSPWSACPAACDSYGTQTRSCNNPLPADGGASCTGDSTQSCYGGACPPPPPIVPTGPTWWPPEEPVTPVTPKVPPVIVDPPTEPPVTQPPVEPPVLPPVTPPEPPPTEPPCATAYCGPVESHPEEEWPPVQSQSGPGFTMTYGNGGAPTAPAGGCTYSVCNSYAYDNNGYANCVGYVDVPCN